MRVLGDGPDLLRGVERAQLEADVEPVVPIRKLLGPLAVGPSLLETLLRGAQGGLGVLQALLKIV